MTHVGTRKIFSIIFWGNEWIFSKVLLTRVNRHLISVGLLILYKLDFR